ncbi:hypothetical protein [Streptomyces laurentii]|uniref:hypothetical protein n=1 Tax=Streptomyces laurentii TaxID=39478 RepID=UPI0033C8327C
MATEPAHRRQGYARAAVSALLDRLSPAPAPTAPSGPLATRSRAAVTGSVP